jgi:hypothetical protein
VLKSAVTGQRYISALPHKLTAFMVRADLSARVFVWGVWLIMMIADLYILTKLGRVFPLNEDWWLVAPMTGNEPNLFQWYWVQNSEHSIPFPRLILIALLTISHGDYRAGMLFNIGILGALAGSVRGRVFSDRSASHRECRKSLMVLAAHTGRADCPHMRHAVGSRQKPGLQDAHQRDHWGNDLSIAAPERISCPPVCARAIAMVRLLGSAGLAYHDNSGTATLDWQLLDRLGYPQPGLHGPIFSPLYTTFLASSRSNYHPGA